MKEQGGRNVQVCGVPFCNGCAKQYKLEARIIYALLVILRWNLYPVLNPVQHHVQHIAQKKTHFKVMAPIQTRT